jgi:hypothetical protein
MAPGLNIFSEKYFVFTLIPFRWFWWDLEQRKITLCRGAYYMGSPVQLLLNFFFEKYFVFAILPKPNVQGAYCKENVVPNCLKKLWHRSNRYTVWLKSNLSLRYVVDCQCLLLLREVRGLILIKLTGVSCTVWRCPIFQWKIHGFCNSLKY